jgi:hypothetical protein
LTTEEKPRLSFHAELYGVPNEIAETPAEEKPVEYEGTVELSILGLVSEIDESDVWEMGETAPASDG